MGQPYIFITIYCIYIAFPGGGDECQIFRSGGTNDADFTLRAFADAGFYLSGCCIWKKQSLVLGRSPYQWMHEPCLFGWKKSGKHQWYTGRKETTIWEFNKPKKNGDHPTMKPIPLLAYPIMNSSMTKGSGDARMQPLYFLITIAGTDTNSICYETHQKVKDILEGRKIDPTFYPVIYGSDETDDWTDPEVWKKANPSLGITVGIDKVEAACESAKQNPGEENSFRQLRLNQWVKQAVRWMPMEKWDACSFKVDEESLEGRVCYGGLDLSSTTDITTFVLVFPPLNEDDKFCILPYFWIPEDTLDLRVRRDHVSYDVWERQGFLETTEGNVVHYGYIEKFIKCLGERFNIREIAFDRWGAVQMVQNLEGMQ